MIKIEFYKEHGRATFGTFFNIGIIRMTVVMEGYVFAIIAVNT